MNTLTIYIRPKTGNVPDRLKSYKFSDFGFEAEQFNYLEIKKRIKQRQSLKHDFDLVVDEPVGQVKLDDDYFKDLMDNHDGGKNLQLVL